MADIHSWLERLRAARDALGETDEAFVERAFHDILGRPADQGGLDHYTAVLRRGLSRTSVLLELANSGEFRGRLAPPAGVALPNLVAQRPERYRRSRDQSNGASILTFQVEEPADIDWLEAAILAHGYCRPRECGSCMSTSTSGSSPR